MSLIIFACGFLYTLWGLGDTLRVVIALFTEGNKLCPTKHTHFTVLISIFSEWKFYSFNFHILCMSAFADMHCSHRQGKFI